ncbi:50S ribosomal protein L6 [Patescibacteria group bacterium]|jgi:large subunit ribosomal protein L6|nr:50S ribosomal protein L6 [Patescibacteria group bacterium]
MSRIGKQPITIPQGVNISINEAQLEVSGAKGRLTQPLLSGLSIEEKDNQILVSRNNNEAVSRSNHGLMRTLIANMVEGVSQGYSKKLEVIGVGYRVSIQGNTLKLALGFSHDVDFTLPEGISAQVEQNVITINGIDKQQVGQVASEIRELRKPEPYKGKGIRYQNEYIIRKSGKSGKEK